MRSLIHPSATAVLIRQGTPRFQTLHDAIDTLARAEERLEEEVWDVVEQVDDGEGQGKLVGERATGGGEGERASFATVWAKFCIRRDAVVSFP